MDKITSSQVSGSNGVYHRYFCPHTLSRYFAALENNLPKRLRNVRNFGYANGTNPETAYLSVDRRTTPLNWDERRELSILLRGTEKRGNLVVECSNDGEGFELDTYLASSLVRDGHDQSDKLIVGVVGPSAKMYGEKLFELIQRIRSNGLR